MPLDAQIYFYIILSGFITVWTFRFLTHSKKPTNDFEYLGLSAFWGLVITYLAQLYLKWYWHSDAEKMKDVFANPLATGLVFSIIFSPVLGMLGSLLVRPLKWSIEKYKQIAFGKKIK